MSGGVEEVIMAMMNRADGRLPVCSRATKRGVVTSDVQHSSPEHATT